MPTTAAQEMISYDEFMMKAESLRKAGDLAGAVLNEQLAKMCREQARKAEKENG